MKLITDFVRRHWYKALLMFVFCVVTSVVCACAWRMIVRLDKEVTSKSMGNGRTNTSDFDSSQVVVPEYMEGIIHALKRMDSDTLHVEVSVKME